MYAQAQAATFGNVYSRSSSNRSDGFRARETARPKAGKTYRVENEAENQAAQKRRPSVAGKVVARDLSKPVIKETKQEKTREKTRAQQLTEFSRGKQTQGKQAQVKQVQAKQAQAKQTQGKQAQAPKGKASAAHLETGQSSMRMSITSRGSKQACAEHQARVAQQARMTQQSRASEMDRVAQQRRATQQSRATQRKNSPSWMTAEDWDSMPLDRMPRNAEVEEEDFEEKDTSLRGRMKEASRKKKKEKAGREFEKRYDSGSSGEEGPRAALYKGEMGRNHKKAARLQDGGGSSGSGRRGSSARRRNFLRPRYILTAGIAAVMVIFAFILYPTAQQYYLSIREYDRLQLELTAVQERNDAMQNEINLMTSDDGIETMAREDYGWVKSGEHSVVVNGLSVQKTAEEDKVSAVQTTVLSSDIKAPETWYSPFLDKFFGLE